MDGSAVQTYLSDILHVVSQSLLAPDIILLLAFIAYALFCIGSVIAEYFSERRHFNITMPRFLADLMAADEGEIPNVIKKSGLLRRQKIALLTVYDYRTLPGDALVALIRRLVSEEESRYDRITGRNNIAARVSPMLGLMGTLIPLGPGIQALGKADTAALSSSLLVAFDTTVAGLVVAAVCLVVAKIRQNWYGNYMTALDSGMATMLQKIEDMRAEGKITIKEPSDYAFIYENGGAKPADRKPAKKDSAEKGEVAPAPEKKSQKQVPAERKQSTREPDAKSSSASVIAPLPVAEQVPQSDVSSAVVDAVPTAEPAPLSGMGWLPPEAASPLPFETGSIAQQSIDYSMGVSTQPDFGFAPTSPTYGTQVTGDSAVGTGNQAAPTQTQGNAGGYSHATGGWYQPQVHQGTSGDSAFGVDGRVAWGTRDTSLGEGANRGENSGR